MSAEMSRDEVLECIRESLADSLALDAGGIRLESKLIDELGADSLDFLDILFRLEKVFTIALRDSEVNQLLRADAPAASARRGPLSPEEVAKLEEWLPALRSAPDKTKLLPKDIFSYLTVEALVLLVERKMAKDRAAVA